MTRQTKGVCAIIACSSRNWDNFDMCRWHVIKQVSNLLLLEGSK